MRGETAELVDDVLERYVGEGGRGEGTGNKGDLVHRAAGRQSGIGEGRGTRGPGGGGTAGRGKAYRDGGGGVIVYRRHVFGQGELSKTDRRGST